MSSIDLNRLQSIHFIGVGGIGMSGLARHFLSEKKTVSGSDRALTPLTKALAVEGIQVFSEQSSENIADSVDLVVYTEAVTPESEGWVELERARELNIPTLNYFDALGLAMNPYYLIAVAGTHGKTTTTAMLTDIFEAAGKDPTAVIGSLRAKTKSNYRAGKSKYAIVEACEYKRDFLSLRPDILIITNLEFDHADYYQDLADVQAAFRTLAEQINEGGVLVADTKNPHVGPVLDGLSCTVIDYQEYFDPTMKLTQPGIHNRQNAAAATAAARHERIDLATCHQALGEFTGTWRRFELKGEYQGAPVYDDYAHHPTAITLAIAGARELYPDRAVHVVFEPHTFSRTKALFGEFARALATADRTWLLPIYAAREQNESGVSSRELAVKALEYNSQVVYVASQADAVAALQATADERRVIIVMGAGTVTQVATELTT